MSIRTPIAVAFAAVLLIQLVGAATAPADQPPEAGTLVFNDLAGKEVPLFIDLLSAASDIDGDPLGCRITRSPTGQLTPGPSPCTFLYEPTQGNDSFDFEVYQLSDGTTSQSDGIVVLTFFKSGPGNPTATATGPNSIRLAWFDVDGEVGYEIYSGTNPTNLPSVPTAALPAASGSSVLYWNDLGLQPETTYFYEIDACYVDVCLTSPLLSATTPGAAQISAPVAIRDSFEVAEGRTLFIPYEQLLDNDYHPNGDPISFLDFTPLQLAFPTSQNQLVEVVGGFRYHTVPSGLQTEDYTDSFSYRISDGNKLLPAGEGRPHRPDWSRSIGEPRLADRLSEDGRSRSSMRTTSSETM